MKHILLLFTLFSCCQLLAQEQFVFSPINTSNGLSDNRVRAIAQLSDGRMVFATEGLVNIYDGTEFSYLLSPYRRPGKTNKREHDGTIITDAPNVMWATDGKRFWIDGSGWHWFFGVIDHFNDEIISWHIARKGNRFAAMEPVRAAVRKTFGSVGKDVCKGMKLQLRSDHGSQYDSADFMNEMKFLGLEMSKAFVRSPQCNGIIERFHRTLEEQVLQTETFSSFEEAYNSINQFINDYNTDWILHRLEYCSPVEYREKYAESQRKENDDIPSGNKDPEVQLVLISSGSMPRRNEIAHQAMVKGAITYSNTPSINPSV